MTREEFNEKYKTYIESGFETQGLEFDEPKVTEFLDNIFQTFINIPGFNYSQIKLKFDYCRFYVNNVCQDICWMVEQEVDRILRGIDYKKS